MVADDGSTATDEDTLKKAMRRKAAKNLDFAGMEPPPSSSSSSSSSSFISLPTTAISSKLNFVGIRLGNSANEINVSANVL
jgi:hypothetical protein